ncbi:MAG TPA: acyl-CoA dehydrogenase family protein, partial [Saprospiraceae bacterium]|nr:acyl-CoA dehydrogenase family protein [Saprospiraceae bacterium]
MEDTLIKTGMLNGGEFLIKESSFENTFVPEEMTEDQKMILSVVKDFIVNEIDPVAERLEKQEEGLNTSLLEKAGSLGLLGTHMPEQYGGMELDTNTNTIIADWLGYMGVGFTVA